MPDPRPATTEEIIQGYAKMYGVPPDLALAVAKKESNFDPSAVGDGGQALGTFQLHEGAATDTGVDRTDPTQNIIGGIKYLGQLSKRYKGDVSKVLQAYNGGMEGVDAGTPSAAAQAYASDVLGNLSQGLRTQAAAGKPTFTDESTPIKAQPPQPDITDSLQVLPGITIGNVKGFAKEAGARVTQLGAMVRKRFPSLAVGPEVTFPTTPTNQEQQAGQSAERVAEFLGASELTGGATAAAPLLAKAAAQAATSYGVSKLQGGSETESRVNAALGAIGPVVSEALPLVGQKIRDRAVNLLAMRLTKGLAEPGPEVRYALKTGDVAPDVKSAVGIVRRAASDILDAPLQLSWGKWLTTLGKDSAAKGAQLGEALKGPLGTEPLFKQPIIDQLDKLLDDSAQHFAELQSGASGMKAYDEELFNQVKALKDAINASGENKAGYANAITIKNLSDLKRTWDKAVFTLSTSGKVGIDPEALLNTAKKEAREAGANAIRDLFREKAPTIAQLNQAVSHAYQLQELVKAVYKAQPGAGRWTQALGHAGGSFAGYGIGELIGHPLLGMGGGGVIGGNLLVRAIESPVFQTLSPAIRNQLAQAMAEGNAKEVLRIAGPLIQAETTAPATR